jgi:hypothetical protein
MKTRPSGSKSGIGRIDFMPQREFDITIGPDGHVHLEMHGFKGKGCLNAAKLFAEIVGEMKSQQPTSEFYEPEEVVHYNIEQRH